MSKHEVFWGLVSMGLILLAYILPYTILTGVARWYGSFLLWVVIAVVIIGVNYIVAREWRA
ncbi:hypothetical protein D0469_06195 [Peribacillus saganii]|uniref:Uncharacterized protein n=1 Tax=Peribacillus saganii TaxID=2303992 RepID=A0A372LQP2_9BACI|nr:hypothetical protein [Peribacillus saganii]RFU70521.1 hypothetical protein D0469_06195 [Peribacillus saganii]